MPQHSGRSKHHRGRRSAPTGDHRESRPRDDGHETSSGPSRAEVVEKRGDTLTPRSFRDGDRREKQYNQDPKRYETGRSRSPAMRPPSFDAQNYDESVYVIRPKVEQRTRNRSKSPSRLEGYELGGGEGRSRQESLSRKEQKRAICSQGDEHDVVPLSEEASEGSHAYPRAPKIHQGHSTSSTRSYRVESRRISLLSGVGLDFAKIEMNDFTGFERLLAANPTFLDEDFKSFFQEAIYLSVEGENRRARMCVQVFVLLRECASLLTENKSVRAFVQDLKSVNQKIRTLGETETLKIFWNEVDTTMKDVKSRAVLVAEAKEGARESSRSLGSYKLSQPGQKPYWKDTNPGEVDDDRRDDRRDVRRDDRRDDTCDARRDDTRDDRCDDRRDDRRDDDRRDDDRRDDDRRDDDRRDDDRRDVRRDDKCDDRQDDRRNDRRDDRIIQASEKDPAAGRGDEKWNKEQPKPLPGSGRYAGPNNRDAHQPPERQQRQASTERSRGINSRDFTGMHSRASFSLGSNRPSQHTGHNRRSSTSGTDDPRKNAEAFRPEPSRRPTMSSVDEEQGTNVSVQSPTVDPSVVPEIRGTPGHREGLDGRYQRRLDAKKFFNFGRVFALLWTEGAGETSQGTHISDAVTYVAFGQRVHSHIRRMVVVKECHGYCICIPINTYNSQGVAKKGLTKEERLKHTIIHMSDKKARMIEAEEGMMHKRPIAVNPANAEQKLDFMSRLNFGAPSTVQWNVKVMNVGKVHKNSTTDLLGYFRNAMEQPDRD